MDINTLQEYVTLGKDIATGLAALVAAYVGFTGLQTWKRQLTANAEYDLARRVLTAVYKLQKAIRLCRLPPVANVDHKEAETIKKMHVLRISQLEEAEESLDVELLEAEAVWGDLNEYSFSVTFFRTLSTEMYFAYSQYYWNSDDLTANEKVEAYSLLFTDVVIGEEDEFYNRLEGAVKRVEDFLRPKLTLKQRRIIKLRWSDRLKRYFGKPRKSIYWWLKKSRL
jgi:hypothetical protein